MTTDQLIEPLAKKLKETSDLEEFESIRGRITELYLMAFKESARWDFSRDGDSTKQMKRYKAIFPHEDPNYPGSNNYVPVRIVCERISYEEYQKNGAESSFGTFKEAKEFALECLDGKQKCLKERIARAKKMTCKSVMSTKDLLRCLHEDIR